MRNGVGFAVVEQDSEPRGRASGKPTMVPYAALHAVGRENKRLKARVAELEAVVNGCTCQAATTVLNALPLSAIVSLAEAEHDGLVRLPGEIGENPTNRGRHLPS